MSVIASLYGETDTSCTGTVDSSVTFVNNVCRD